MANRIFRIDCFPENVPNHRDVEAIVAIDVIRATTTAVTACATGRRCLPVATLEEAEALAAVTPGALLAGELSGDMPAGFDLNNSPAEIERRTDIERPVILLSTSGTRVVCSVGPNQRMYAACLRNYSAQARYLTQHHSSVALIGAGSKGEFREEDELCCAWIADLLLAEGFEPRDEATLARIDRWRGARVEDILPGNSADYLRRSGQTHDLDFVLSRVDDLQAVYEYQGTEIRAIEGSLNAAA